MHIKLLKLIETPTNVSYAAETDVVDFSLPDNYRIAKGLLTFNKQTNKITFNAEKTDPYYFESKREAIHIQYHLKELNNNKKIFPEIYIIATG